MTDDSARVDTAPLEHESSVARSRWRRRRPLRWMFEWVLVLVLALVVALVMRTYVFQTFYIPSRSMLPTLHVGDRIIVSKLSVTWGTIHRGDILVFQRPHNESICGQPAVSDLVKRVIGLPGNDLWNVGNVIYVNGVALQQNWSHNEPIGNVQITNSTGEQATASNPEVVPPNSYYMMGDNEADSCDSRYWGPINRSLIVGKVVMRIWPPSRIGFL